MLSVRYLIAGGILYAWSVRRGDRAGDRPGPRQWRAAATVGGLLLVFDTGLVTWALHRGLDTGLAALLCATVPLWLAFSDRRVTAGKIGGVVTGLAGVAFLVGPSWSHLDMTAVVAVLIATLGWVGGSLYAKSAPLPKRANVSAGMEMLAAGAMLAVISGATGEWSQVHAAQIHLSALLALLYLITFGSVLAYPAYGWLIHNVSTPVLSTHAYVNPMVAVVLGAAVLGEPLSAMTVLAGLLVIVSVVLIIGVPERFKTPPPARRVGLPRPAVAEISSFAA
jgi:drug/metabolite transporter (DMT)-like permease